jgi:hypothetical protein
MPDRLARQLAIYEAMTAPRVPVHEKVLVALGVALVAFDLWFLCLPS